MFPQDQGDVKELLIGQEYLTITGKSGNDGNGRLQNYDYSTQGERIHLQERKPYIEMLTSLLIKNYV